MVKTKKIPLRKSVVSNEQFPKKELLRIVYNKAGEISIDPTGKAAGRGAYICPKQACFDAARKSRGLERSFKSPIDAAVYERLEQEMQAITIKAED